MTAPATSVADRLLRPAHLVLPLVLIVIAFFHVFRLVNVPRGLYVDEVSIGYNAMTMAESGVDEHGVAAPLYFEAEGYYKNPFCIYAAALMFRLAGPSELHLRLTSALFFLLALVIFVWLLMRLFPESPSLWVFGALALGFSPHYFTISRAAFESISELPFLVAVLLGTKLTFEAAGRRQVIRAGLTGLVLGLSVYTYHTNRVYSPLMLAAIVLCWLRRDRLPALVVMSGVFALLLLPLGLFVFAHPAALMRRFNDVTYLWNPGLSLPEKLMTFWRSYSVHFGPGFLLLRGDGNLRHTSGTGVMLWTTLALAIAGVVALGRDRRLWSDPNIRLVAVLALLAPVPAALTEAPTGHVMRSLPLSLYLLLFSCWGFQAIVRAASGVPRRAIPTVAFFLLLVESGAFVREYFTSYPARSVAAFCGAGYPEMLKAAFERQPREVRYWELTSPKAMYAYVEFYRRLLRLPLKPPILPQGSVAEADTCAIFLQDPPPPGPDVRVARRWENPAFAIHMRCYERARWSDGDE